MEDLLGRMTLEEKVMQVTQWTYGKNMNVNNVESETKAVSPMIGSLLYRSTSPAYYNRIRVRPSRSRGSGFRSCAVST